MAMPSAKIAVASDSAIPTNRLPVWVLAASGLRMAALTNWPNRMPIPAPAPATPTVAIPAPRYLAAWTRESAVCWSIVFSPFLIERLKSVMRMQRVVQIEAAQDGEDVSLQHGDEELEADEHDDEDQGADAGETHQDDEAREHLQHGVADQHVEEKTNRQADRADEIGNDLDRDQQRQHEYRRAGRREQAQEADAVLGDADDGDADEHGQRQCQGDDDLAGDREAVRDHPQHVAKQDEDEQREDERKVFLAFAADVLAHQIGDEVVAQFAQRLQPAGDQGPAVGAQGHHQHDRRHGDNHPQRRIGERQVDLAEFDRDQVEDFELMNWTFAAGCHDPIPSSSRSRSGAPWLR